MKTLNRYVVILLSIAPAILSAGGNFDLMNADWQTAKTSIIYYRITSPARLASPAIKSLSGSLNLRVDVKDNELLSLDLSTDPTMAKKVKTFEFSTARLQNAFVNIKSDIETLLKKKNKTPEDQKALDILQKGAVNATTCYVYARVKSPSDKDILLSPQDPSKQDPKKTAQGLSLKSNISPLLVAVLEGMAGLTEKLGADFIAFAMKNETPLFMVQQIANFYDLLVKVTTLATKKEHWKALGNTLLTQNIELVIGKIKEFIPTLSKKQTEAIIAVKEYCLDNLTDKQKTIAAAYTIAQRLQSFTGTTEAYINEWRKVFKAQFPQLFKNLNPAQILFLASINYLEKTDIDVISKKLGNLLQ